MFKQKYILVVYFLFFIVICVACNSEKDLNDTDNLQSATDFDRASDILGLDIDELPEGVIKLGKVDFSDALQEMENINADPIDRSSEIEDSGEDLSNKFPDPDSFLEDNLSVNSWDNKIICHSEILGDNIFSSETGEDSGSTNLEYYICVNKSAKDELIKSLEDKFSNTRGIFGSHNNYTKHMPTIKKLHATALETKRKVCSLILQIKELQLQIRKLVKESDNSKQIEEELLKAKRKIEKNRLEIELQDKKAILEDKEKILDYVIGNQLTEKRALQILKAYSVVDDSNDRGRASDSESLKAYKGVEWFGVDMRYYNDEEKDESKWDHLEITSLNMPKENSDLTIVSIYRDENSEIHLSELEIETQKKAENIDY